MESKDLLKICILIVILVGVVSATIIFNHNLNNYNIVETSDDSSVEDGELADDSSSESNSDPLSGLEGSDLYRATHSDLIVVGVVQTSNGNYIYCGGSADGES